SDAWCYAQGGRTSRSPVCHPCGRHVRQRPRQGVVLELRRHAPRICQYTRLRVKHHVASLASDPRWTPVHTRLTPSIVPPCASTSCTMLCCTLDFQTGCCTRKRGF